MQKVVSIVGPTGVGKTSLAFDLAKKFDFELVSADSVQVFKRLDIISGKDIPKTSKYTNLPKLSSNGFNAGYYTYHNVPIFLLDVVEPTVLFSVSQFENLASEAIKYISKKNKIPVIVGGTGLYVNSLTSNISTYQIKPDSKLRKSLEKLDVKKLQKRLKELDNKKFERMNYSDANNPRRLIRAIEVSESRIKNQELRIENEAGFEYLVIGLKCERDVLKKRIDARVKDRLKNGALKETESLFKNYKNLSPQVKNANGYKQLFQYLKKEIDLDEAIYRWKISEYRHAKNQMTWFRKYGDVKWFDIEKKGFEKAIEIEVGRFLN